MATAIRREYAVLSDGWMNFLGFADGRCNE